MGVCVPKNMPKGMTLTEVRDLLGAEVLSGGDLSQVINFVGAADLMSDVLALSRSGMLLLTGLATVQAVRTAAVSDLKCVVFVRAKRPGDDVINLAAESSIPLMSTAYTMFEASGILYAALNRS